MLSSKQVKNLKIGDYIYCYDDVRNIIIRLSVIDNCIESREIRTKIGCLMSFSQFVFMTKESALKFAINYQRDLISIAEMKIQKLLKQLEQENGN